MFGELYTRAGVQLEVHCSGDSKTLLAYLPEAEREAYLANGGRVWPIGIRPILSERPRPQKDRWDSCGDDFKISTNRQRTSIDNVARNSPPVRYVVSAADLPQTSDTRANTAIVFEIAPIFAHFVENYRPWADNAHLTKEHVKQLGQFVDAAFSQKTS